MQIIIVADWPRIAQYKGEILEGVTLCWCRIGDEEAQSQELNAVRESIEQAVQFMTCAVTRDCELVDEYQTLIDSDGRLRDLLLV